MRNPTMKHLTKIITLLLIFTINAFSGDYKILTKDIPLGTEKSVIVDMELALADLTIAAGKSDFILQAHVSYNPEKMTPIIDYSTGETGILDIECKKISKLDIDNIGVGENDWNLKFTDRLLLEFKIEMGLGNGELDLTGLQIENISIEIGLSEILLKFDKPNEIRMQKLKIESGLGALNAKGLLNANFERFKFTGGLGVSELYFTGEITNTCEATIEVGLGSIDVYLQRGIPVKIYTEKSFLSSVELEDFIKERSGVHISRNWDENAPNALILELKVGLGSVSVEWIEE